MTVLPLVVLRLPSALVDRVHENVVPEGHAPLQEGEAVKSPFSPTGIEALIGAMETPVS
jgi:hypothetical protein